MSEFASFVASPRNRLRDIGEARIAIEEVQNGAVIDRDVPQVPVRRQSRVWVGIAAVLFLTTIFFAALSVLYFRTAPPEIRLEVITPSTTDPTSFSISPDGRRLETGTLAALFPVRIAGGPLPGPNNKQQYALCPWMASDSLSISPRTKAQPRPSRSS